MDNTLLTPKPTSTSTTIKVQEPNLPKGGGAIQGMGEKFVANEFTGTAGISLPIPATACRNITPQLSLGYSSGSGNSSYGIGWALELAVISRKTSKGIPQYNTSDTFLYNGEDLVLAKQQGRSSQTLNGIIYNILLYYPRNQGSFAIIEYWQPQDATQQNAAFWKIISSTHEVSIFGYNTQAKIVDPDNSTHIFSWLLEENYNAEGDHQLFFYKQENNENVPVVDHEKNHKVSANRYIQFIRYGYDEALHESMVLTKNVAVNDPNQWHFELVFDYGEYHIDPVNNNPYLPTQEWSCRPDPFSSYTAGFEIRTYRRCLHSLLFHRFKELGDQPVLVKVLAYTYQTNAITLLSHLAAVQEIGYRYQNTTQTYLTQAIPELLFDYTNFQPNGHTFDLLKKTDQQFLPGLDQSPNYQLVDLYGEGIPGILYADGQSVYYQQPVLTPLNTQAEKNTDSLGITVPAQQAHLSYHAPQPCSAFPINRSVQAADITLADMTGDGLLDIVINNKTLKGYYQARTINSWNAFQPFVSFPASYSQPDQELVDLVGNNLSDLVQINKADVRVYPSQSYKGFGKSWEKPHAANFPVILTKTKQVWVTFSNMAGSDTPSLVQIKQNEITYWPSVGYGHFAEPIVMSNAPDFGAAFDTSRLFLVDIDGSGTTDLVYFQANKILLYLNQSGNAFADPIEIALPFTFDDLDQINFADIYGRGTNCLIISVAHAEPKPVYWCYDFCQQIKPYLLNQIDNNLGATTQIIYASSVDYYLADTSAGLPWITKLPFPVQVVAQTISTDAISKTTYISQYAYHHGYYDGVEREFRGFGCVDRQDTETIQDFSTRVASYQAPPAFTKTWYHTGAFEQAEALNKQYQKEYWQGDAAAYEMPPTIFNYQQDPSAEDIRQAYVALSGTLIRSELYGLDGSQWQANPYTVQQNRMQVNELQAKDNNHYAVFLTYGIESIAYDYERNAADPHCNHNFTLALDEYGHALKSCSVAYGRRNIPATQPGLYASAQQTSDQQTAIRFTYQQNSYINQPATANYLLGVDAEQESYNIVGLTPESNHYFNYAQLVNVFANGIQSLPDAATATLLTWEKDYYFDPVAQIELAFGQTTLQALHCRTEFIQYLTNNIPKELQVEIDNPQNGYIKDEANNCYWNPGNFQAYYAQEKFYLPAYYCNALHYQDWQLTATERSATCYSYDTYCLFIDQVVDPLQNKITFPSDKIDYQVLSPTQIIDANGNFSEVLFDPLGNVIVTSQYGTEGDKRVGFDPLSDYTLPTEAHLTTIINDPAAYLQQAASFFYYDLFAWRDKKTPVCVLQLAAQDFIHARNAVINPLGTAIAVAYNDGFGRVLQTKTPFNQPDTIVRTWDVKQQQVLEKTADFAWLTSGAVQYDNKGNPIKQYEPFFSDSYLYINEAALNIVGVSDTIFYDALEREVLTITANGYLSKTLFGYLATGTTESQGGYLAKELYENLPGQFYPSSWNSLAFDDIDAIRQSPYYQQASAAEKITLDQLPYNTPALSYADSLGRVVQSEQLLVAANQTNATYVQLDILGNALTQADARLFAEGASNFQSSYNLAGQVLQQIAVDGGTQWSLTNIVGSPCYQLNSRRFAWRFQYDVLQRPLTITVSGGDGVVPMDAITELFIYGESFSEPELWNRRGQAIAHFDQSGLSLAPFTTIDGQPLTSLKSLCKDYKNTPNWRSINAQIQQQLIAAIEQIKQPNQIQTINLSYINQLETEKYTTSADYHANGLVMQSTDPDGNVTTPQYYVNGALKSNQISDGPAVEQITYNAKAQRMNVVYGNQITTTYAYEAKTFRLQNITSIYTPTNKVMQDYTYRYDPVSNITEVKRNDVSTIYFNNQIIDATNTYDYDSLYRLVSATGREHTHSTKQDYAQSSTLSQPLSNGLALQNYRQQYQYDAGNNLLSMQHSSAALNTAWTRNFTISSTCNQLTQSQTGKLPALNYQYDTMGNMQNLTHVRTLQWNERNNIQAAVIIERDTISDAEYYVYDAGGQRIRKVHEQQTQSGTRITDSIYLGNFEIRRTKTQLTDNAEITTKKDWRVIRFMDDTNCVAVWRYAIENGQRATAPDQNQQRYQLVNHLNSSIMEVDTQGELITYEEYYPFGGTAFIAAKTLTDAHAKYYRYSFKERDETTGLYYYGMRYYPSWLGRWLNPDPAGTIDGLNLYAFVGGNPSTYVDVGGMTGNKRGSRPKKSTKTSTSSSKSSGSTQRVKRQRKVGSSAASSREEITPIGEEPIQVGSSHQESSSSFSSIKITAEMLSTVDTFKAVVARGKKRTELTKEQHETLIYNKHEIGAKTAGHITLFRVTDKQGMGKVEIKHHTVPGPEWTPPSSVGYVMGGLSVGSRIWLASEPTEINLNQKDGTPSILARETTTALKYGWSAREPKSTEKYRGRKGNQPKVVLTPPSSPERTDLDTMTSLFNVNAVWGEMPMSPRTLSSKLMPPMPPPQHE